MLRIVTGRSGSGKSEEMIRLMKSCENAIYIVPEQYSFAAEKKITSVFGISGIGNPNVYSFRRLAYHMEETFGWDDRKDITASGRVMVLQDIIRKISDKLTLFGGVAKRGEMAQEAAVIITTLKQYNVTKEKLQIAIEKTGNSLLKKKLSDCIKIGEEYEKFLNEGYRDSEDILESLKRNIVKSEKMAGSDIFIDSFTAFTPLEMGVIGEMLKKCKSVTVSLCVGEGDSFVTAKKTFDALVRLSKQKGVAYAGEKSLEGAMFTASDELKCVEKSFFEDCTYPKNTHKIRVYHGKNEYEEAIYAAKEIERLCRDEGYRYRDIVVVARDMENYEREFARVFDRFKIPLFMDKKTPLSGEAAAIFMLSAIRIISRGWKNEAVFAYMKTAFSPLDDIEKYELESYCLAAGVRVQDWRREEDWDMCPSVKEGEVEKNYLDRINNLRRKVAQPLLNLEKKINGRRTGREFSIAFYEFLEECGIEEKINSIAKRMTDSGEADIANRMKQVYDLVVGVLESFDGAFSEKKLNAAEFLDIISRGTESVEIGIIPSTTDSVCAGSIDRARGHGAKAVIIVGAVEGRFPQSPKETGIFTNSDRRELASYEIELPPDTLGKTFMEESLVYGALTCATDRLLVTYCDTKESSNPSAIVKRLKRVFPCMTIEEGVGEITSAHSSYEDFVVEYARSRQGELTTDEWYTAADYYKNHEQWKDKVAEIEKYTQYENKTEFIREELIKRRYGTDIRTSVSALEKYSKCPFSYFARVTLGLKERQELEVTAADSGTFLHEFVDMFGKELYEEGRRWQNIDEGYIDRKTEEIALKLLNGVNRHLISSSPRVRHLFAELKRIGKRSVTVMSLHMKKGKFEPLGYEIVFDEKGDFKPLKIELPNGCRISLRGRVDRADILSTDRGRFVRIIDYKSGEKKFSVNNIYQGFDLQLAIYLTAICENGNYRPAGMLYFKIDDPVIDAAKDTDDRIIGQKIMSELKMDGLVLEDDEILEAMDAAYASGSDVIPVKKKKDGSFTAASQVATEGDFKALSKHMKKTVKKLCSEILSGENKIAPVKGACDWCEMKPVCGFDTTVKGCNYRYVDKINDKDALLKIIEEQ